MPLFKVKTDNDEALWINPEHTSAMKFHPDDKHPKCGYILTPSGKEFWIELQSFRTMLKQATKDSIDS